MASIGGSAEHALMCMLQDITQVIPLCRSWRLGYPSLMSNTANNSINSADTHHKALHINLDPHRYGTFAEIGAGQEVASWFFRVGAASGTIAKSMSAYDMTVSDSIYGKTGRYVSQERLMAMLDHEYKLLIERLAPARGAETGFFVFADTVSARNFAGTNESHGWMGIRFQASPKAEPSQIVLHVNMTDTDSVRQSEALGILGVNLTYGAFYLNDDVDQFLSGLVDGLPNKRVEIDYIELSGPLFNHLNMRLVTIALLRKGLASVILFDTEQRPVPPTEFFHKRPVLLERGAFRALHHLFPDLFERCNEKLQSLAGMDERETAYVLELSLNNILRTQQSTDDEVLDVVEQLCKSGGNHNILVSTYSEFFHLTQYLRRYSSSPFGFVVSAALLPLLLEDDRYGLLRGGVLEASARLFHHQVHLLVYPVESKTFGAYLTFVNFDVSRISFPEKGMVTAQSLKLGRVNQHLFRYLVESSIIVDVDVNNGGRE